MPTSLTTTTLSAKDWRMSFGDHPRVFPSGADFYMRTPEGAMTIVETKATESTTAPERPQTRIPRVASEEQPERLGFMLLQKWEGTVIEADSESFTAQLFDSLGKLPPHDATFSRSELDLNECALVEPGAPFVWILGYRQIGSTRERASVIYFRRLPGWTEKEITQAKQNGKTVADELGWR